MQNSDNIVYVFGDSHCTTFVGAEKKFKTCVCGLDAASILGLNRKDSRLEYGKHILDTIRYQPKTCHILIKLGQVDMEFIIYYKLYVKKEIFTLQEYCKLLIDKYREFIKKIFEINTNVTIVSINLPAYHDNVNIQDYIKRIISESLISPTDDTFSCTSNDTTLSDFSLTQITKNFMYFNKALSDLADEMNLKFFDLTLFFIDSNTKLLKNEYRYHGHHYKGYNDIAISDVKTITHNFFHSFFEEHYGKTV